ncbi:hypothetical protein V7793_32385 [Streptomyces sp. KLMMK]|uniref:hypothetical protein n=1 Tax=Streptomyces sp. KLMMK TaxID=3109353 RepID=UPI00300AC076
MRWVRHAYKIHAPRTRCLRDGELSVKQVAARLGVDPGAVYYWLAHGLTPGRKDPSGRWCIPWTPETQADYRRQITGSAHLKPSTPLMPAGDAV